MKKPTLRTVKLTGELVMCAHSDEVPNHEDWSEYMRIVASVPVERLRMLVFIGEKGPTAAQREEVNEYIAGRPFKIAVITTLNCDTPLATLLSWFNQELKAFCPANVEATLSHLAMRRAELLDLGERMRTVIAELDTPLLSHTFNRFTSALSSPPQEEASHRHV